MIKLVAFLILSGKIAGQEIGALLVDTPEGTKKQFPAGVYAVSFVLGIICLAVAYSMAIGGISWTTLCKMSETVLIGFVGMLLLFYGMRFLSTVWQDTAMGELPFGYLISVRCRKMS